MTVTELREMARREAELYTRLACGDLDGLGEDRSLDHDLYRSWEDYGEPREWEDSDLLGESTSGYTSSFIDFGEVSTRQYQVYVLRRDRTWEYKIGYTGNIENRMRKGTTWNPCLRPVRMLNVGSLGQARRIESLLHTKYAAYRMNHGRGQDWFKLSPSAFQELMEFMQKLQRALI